MDCGSLTTANWIAIVSVVVGLGILGAALYQLINMKRAIRSQAYSSITSDLHALDKLFITCPSLDQLLDEESPTGENKIKQKWLVFWYLDLYENVHFQKNESVIPGKLWEGWEKEIEETFKHRGVKKQYDYLKKRYNEDFRNYIEKLLKRQANS